MEEAGSISFESGVYSENLAWGSGDSPTILAEAHPDRRAV
jgi:hypothetical protein